MSTCLLIPRALLAACPLPTAVEKQKGMAKLMKKARNQLHDVRNGIEVGGNADPGGTDLICYRSSIKPLEAGPFESAIRRNRTSEEDCVETLKCPAHNMMMLPASNAAG
ncbi:uncharacterized protein MYCGRDRAFT_88627 [Zymoseptoria tritici IPO323]|uniref:Uncharacterized protein n=1 Tax=Zymoseptoria tritici (strain CBS 115943 / IPO323) TaxID=336722 RepID=F9WZF9_ZYMTI|nr:uncharacterized protein MYCGRDRAFT_88627 [Zymoseptoria tritici IPO323]EGP92764.1 hypothetical protein MYCGRDRAFT_88627 [Zymoseptoria tritici IPO323]